MSKELQERLVQAVIDWYEQDKVHVSDCGCRNCIALARVAEELKRKRARRSK